MIFVGHDPKLLDGQTDQLNEQLSELCTRINIPCILITLGTEGVLCYKKHSPHLHFPFNNLEESKAISILKVLYSLYSRSSITLTFLHSFHVVEKSSNF